MIGYTGHGLRALGIVLPLHVLILALIWSAGALRLHGRESRPLLRWLPIVVVLIMGLALLSGWWRAAAWPLMAAFGFSAWLPAFLALVIGSLAALALLLSAARALSQSRAAHETSHLHSERYLAHVGAREAAAQLRQARQLGAQSQATRLPARPGLWAIVWKELVRSLRGWRQGLWSWLGVVALSIGLVVAPDWGSRLVTVVFWVQLVARRATATLRDDLTHWWLWRQQPFPAWQLVGGALAPPAALLVLLALLAGVIGARLPFAVDSSWAPLLPLLGVQVALVATWICWGDTARQVTVRRGAQDHRGRPLPGAPSGRHGAGRRLGRRAPGALAVAGRRRRSPAEPRSLCAPGPAGRQSCPALRVTDLPGNRLLR